MLTCKFRQSVPEHFIGTRSVHPYRPRAQVLSTPAVSQLKITSARLRANSAAEPNEFRDGTTRAIPCTTDDTDRASPRTFSHIKKNRRSQPRSPGSCSLYSRPERGAAGARMVPEPPRTTIDEHKRTAPTCDASKSRRSSIDRYVWVPRIRPSARCTPGAPFHRVTRSPGCGRALPARRGNTYGTRTRTSCGPASAGTRCVRHRYGDCQLVLATDLVQQTGVRGQRHPRTESCGSRT